MSEIKSIIQHNAVKKPHTHQGRGYTLKHHTHTHTHTNLHTHTHTHTHTIVHTQMNWCGCDNMEKFSLSLKRIVDLQALAVSDLVFAPGMARAFLYPRPRYVPKVPTFSPGPIVLQAFCHPPFQERLNLCHLRSQSCPVA